MRQNIITSCAFATNTIQFNREHNRIVYTNCCSITNYPKEEYETLLTDSVEDFLSYNYKDLCERLQELTKLQDVRVCFGLKNCYRDINEECKRQSNDSGCKFLPNRQLNCFVVRQCNLNCAMCYYEHNYLGIEHKLLEHFLKIIKGTRQKSIKLSEQGEPFINNTIYDFILNSSSEDVKHFSICTNGTLLTRDKLLALSEHFKKTNQSLKLTFSIDGTSREDYIRVRKVDKFDYLVELVKYALTLPNIEVAINFAHSRLNDKSLHNFHDFWIQIGVEKNNLFVLEVLNDNLISSIRYDKDRGIVSREGLC